MEQTKKIIWITGLSASGKTTLGKELAKILKGRLFDGDEMRKKYANFDYSETGIRKNVIDIGVEAINNLAESWSIVCCISPFLHERDTIRRLSGNRFIEVYLGTPIEICKVRDFKGIYKIESNVVGIHIPYEVNPEAELKIFGMSKEESLSFVLKHIT